MAFDEMLGAIAAFILGILVARAAYRLVSEWSSKRRGPPTDSSKAALLRKDQRTAWRRMMRGEDL